MGSCFPAALGFLCWSGAEVPALMVGMSGPGSCAVVCLPFLMYMV